ncbi:MAG TPA: hypothetical protein VMP08_22100, partial [Anaerolineae bacterium]|nr:hypothetical protein [Anaerolineae bacterium]
MIGKQLASSYPWWAMLIAFLVGMAVGLIVLGWGLWPVRWYDGKPSTLSQQYQQSYLNDSANSYAVGMPINEVSAQLGEDWKDAEPWNKESDMTDMKAVVGILNGMIQSNYAGNVQRLTTFRDALQAYGTVGPANAPANVQGISSQLAIVLAILILILVIIGAFLILRRLRSEKPQVMAVTPTAAPTAEAGAAVVVPAVSRAAGGARPVEKTAWPGESRAPLTQFATTYAFGDDRYDMSSSIETSGGDFLGECGVGISETTGTGTPEKVTALEVWVFDKNDVRTVTKVLMSEFAFNDAALRAKLAPKGDALLARPGEMVELKTQTLKINARIVDVVYGGGTPANSYFQQVTLELATWSDSQ